MWASLWYEFEQELIGAAGYKLDRILDDSSSDQGGLNTTVQALHEKINRLALVCRAMHELAGERLGITDRELVERITDIDLRDGTEDGNMSPVPKECPQCASKICKKFNRCLFCGYRDESGNPFDTV